MHHLHHHITSLQLHHNSITVVVAREVMVARDRGGRGGQRGHGGQGSYVGRGGHRGHGGRGGNQGDHGEYPHYSYCVIVHHHY